MRGINNSLINIDTITKAICELCVESRDYYKFRYQIRHFFCFLIGLCPDEFEYYDTYKCCYRVYRKPMSHLEAMSFCKNIHPKALLLSLDSYDEYTCIVNRLLKESGTSYCNRIMKCISLTVVIVMSEINIYVFTGDILSIVRLYFIQN